MSTPTDNRADKAPQGEPPEGNSLLLLNELQLLMSEKRTALSLMRTGIAILALPLSVFSVLIATSRYYSASRVMHFLIPVLLVSVGLIALAIYLVLRAVGRLRTLDQHINELKRKLAKDGLPTD